MILDWFGDLESKFGKTEIIVGPMASAKSTLLLMITSMFREFSEEMNCEINLFRPSIDKRNSMSRLHIEKEKECVRVGTTKELSDYVKESLKPGKRKVVVIDEVQFLDSEIINTIQRMANEGNYVLMSGLPLSFRGEYFPFSDYVATMEDMLRIIPEASRHVSRLAKCKVCRGTAEYTQRLLNGLPAPYYDSLIKVDDEKSKAQADITYDYQPRCKEHFYVPGKEEYGFVCFVINKNQGLTLEDIKEVCKTTGKIKVDVTDQIVKTLLAEKQAVILDGGKIYYKPRLSVMRDKDLKI